MKANPNTRLLLGAVAVSAVLLGTLPAAGRGTSVGSLAPQRVVHNSEEPADGPIAGVDSVAVAFPEPAAGGQEKTLAAESSTAPGQEGDARQQAGPVAAGADPPSSGSSGDAQAGAFTIDAPPLPPDFVPEVPDTVTMIGNCAVPVDAIEITSADAAERGQRVFESPEHRIYIRADGSCVRVLKLDGNPLPDFAPEGPLPGPTAIEPTGDASPE